MTDRERAEGLLSGAQIEIRILRRENEVLRAKVEMIDLLAGALYGQPGQRTLQTEAPDIVFEIDHFLNPPQRYEEAATNAMEKHSFVDDLEDVSERVGEGKAPRDG